MLLCDTYGMEERGEATNLALTDGERKLYHVQGVARRFWLDRSWVMFCSFISGHHHIMAKS